jgi:hypothetical protein
MSEFTAIRGVTRTLRSLLMQHITSSSDPELSGVAVHLQSPREMRENNGAQGVSLWLYRVVRNGFTLGKPGRRIEPNQLGVPSLPIDLYFLITPIAQTSDDEQLLLGKVLQVFHDHPTLRGPLLQDALAGGDEVLRQLPLHKPSEVVRPSEHFVCRPQRQQPVRVDRFEARRAPMRSGREHPR